MLTIEDFVRRFPSSARGGGDKWAVSCPTAAHDHGDKSRSASVGLGSDGRILFHCFKGCSTESVLAILGLGWPDVLPDRAGGATAPHEVAAYDYKDESGALLYQVVRFHPKDFRQRRPDGKGGWIWKLEGVRRVPYRLPELLASKSDPVYVVEGEKDADLLWAMGYPATTNAGGAGKWLDTYGEFFEGRNVAVLPDNDKVGLDHARAIVKSLERYRAKAAHIIKLPGLAEKGDVSDWFRAAENTREKFDDLVYEEFHIAELDRQATEETVNVDAADIAARESWSPYDLVRNSAIKSPEGFMYGEVFPRRTISMIFGESSSGKSYFVMYLGAQIALGEKVHGMATNPGRVLFLSEEMTDAELKYRSAVVWSEEFRQALSPNRFHFRWFSGFDFAGKTLHDNRSVADFVRICEKTNKPDIVFIDSLSRIMPSGDENSNKDMGVVMGNLEMAARLANVAIVFIHHTSKPSEFREGKHRARGASRIIDSVNDAFIVECISAQDRKSVVTCVKARSVVGRAVPAPFLFTQELDPTGRTVTKESGEQVAGTQFVVADYAAFDRKEDKAAAAVKSALEELVGERMEEGSTTDEVSRIDLIIRLKAENEGWSENRCDKAIRRAVAKHLIERSGRGSYSPVKQ